MINRIFAQPIRAALALALLAATAAAARPTQAIDFESLGRGYLRLHCGRSAEPGSCTLEDVLARDYAHVRLGAFDVWVPARGLGTEELAQDLRTLSMGLLDLQRDLAGWQELDAEVVATLAEDLSKLRDWVGTWSARSLAKAGESDERELLDALVAPGVVRDASERLHATTTGEKARTLSPQFVEGVGLVLCPKRRDFMEMIGFLGLDDPAWRSQHWIEGADQWTQVWKGTRVALALEYAPWTGFDPGFHTSMAPTRIDKDGVLLHVLNQAARALLFRVLNRGDLDHLGRALAANLVIETAGRIAVLDGEGLIRTTGAETMPYERFIPGGLSEGGVLPAIPAAPLDGFAACRWRDGKGTDWFLGALKEGQKEGARAVVKDRKNPKAKDKRAHFVLASDDGETTWVVTAPFLGTWAQQQIYPPTDYLNDYREFYKAYQAAFWHWLRTEGGGDSSAESERHLVQLLRELGRADEEGRPVLEPFEQVVEQIYGVPLSAPDGGTDALEWRFLDWLSKRKR